MKEKIFKYRDTTERFENMLADVLHRNLYRFEIIRDKNLFLNFYENHKIKYHFDVNKNHITEYRYVDTEIPKLIAQLIYEKNILNPTYPQQNHQKRCIYESLNIGKAYKFKSSVVTQIYETKQITNIYDDGTVHLILYKGV